jgi:type IV secretion system protein VirB8
VTEKEEYFGKAEAWAADSREQVARASRAAWIAASVAAAIACFEAVALAMLVPLKTVQSVTLLVDRQTGFVQALDPATPRRVAADEALTQAFLAQYVTAREGFDRATVPADYRKVALWSSGPARAAYLAMMPASNPQSPLNLYRGGAVVRVRVKSISKLREGVALVRFDTLLEDTSSRDVAHPWISTIRYRYVDAPMSLEDRLVNPLGFQVMAYRRDAETLSAVASDDDGSGSSVPPSLNIASPIANRSQPAQMEAAAIASSDGRTIVATHVPTGSPLASRSVAQVRAQ